MKGLVNGVCECWGPGEGARDGKLLILGVMVKASWVGVCEY